MNEPELKVEGLRLGFGGRAILSDFFLTVARGEHVAVTGPSGSGKTTLLRCLLGFAQPDAGVVHVSGEPLSPATVWRARTLIGYVAQEPALGEGLVHEALRRPLAYRANADLRDRPLDPAPWFEQLLLPPELLDAELEALSGGEKQRVALVAALLLDRPILLLDEPTAALDDEARGAVLGLLGALADRTILAVTHADGASRAFGRCVRLPPRNGAAKA